jgi:hypothetical protein
MSPRTLEIIVAAGAAAAMLATPTAVAQGTDEQPQPCSAEWLAKYPTPAVKPVDLPAALARGRGTYFEWHASRSAKSAFRRDDVPAHFTVAEGQHDPAPWSRTTRGYPWPDLLSRSGADLYATATWVEDDAYAEDPDPHPETPPCTRSSTFRVDVVKGYRPKVTLSGHHDLLTFKVLQRKGQDCELTSRGPVRLIVKGPDVTRTLRLSDTCGRWSPSRHGKGWKLLRIDNYGEIGENDPPEAWLSFNFKTPGTRHFVAKAVFRGRTIGREVLDVEVRICTLFGCEG